MTLVSSVTGVSGRVASSASLGILGYELIRDPYGVGGTEDPDDDPETDEDVFSDPCSDCGSEAGLGVTKRGIYVPGGSNVSCINVVLSTVC